jgi:hypothetical protein
MPRADIQVVSPEAFEALHLDVLAGRALGDTDSADSARVAVISRTAVRRFWPDRDPLSSVIRLGTDSRPIRVVGVVSDFMLNWYEPETRPIVYLADAQQPARTTTAILRTRVQMEHTLARIDALQGGAARATKLAQEHSRSPPYRSRYLQRSRLD